MASSKLLLHQDDIPLFAFCYIALFLSFYMLAYWPYTVKIFTCEKIIQVKVVV